MRFFFKYFLHHCWFHNFSSVPPSHISFFSLLLLFLLSPLSSPLISIFPPILFVSFSPLIFPCLCFSSLRYSIMLLHCFLLVGGLLSYPIHQVIAMETCSASGIPGIPGDYMCVNCINASVCVYFLCLFTNLFYAQVFRGCLAEMDEMERKEIKGSQVCCRSDWGK